jgi:hypothetical protein
MFPTFAEYSQKQARDTRDGISDTGPSLRAFLPLPDERERSMIQYYQGAAALVDTRVMCIRPNMTNATLSYKFHLMSEIKIPTELQSWPADSGKRKSWRLHLHNPETPISLNCSIGSPSTYTESERMTSNYYHDNDWPVSLCRSWSSDLLMPEALDMDYDPGYLPRGNQNPYIAINVSQSLHSLELAWTSAVPSRVSNDGEWLQLFFKRNLTDLGMIEQNQSAEYQVSVSLCYSSFNGMPASITAHSAKNRTEPGVGPLSDTQRFADVRRQLGQFSDGIEERGIWQLEEQDWIRSRQPFSSLDYIDAVVDDLSLDETLYKKSIGFLLQESTSRSDYTLAKRFASPDVTTLFQEVLRTGGGLSFALQSVLTVFAGIAYYDEISASSSLTVTPSNQTSFVSAQIPGGNSQYLGAAAGFRTGYTIVMCLLILHNIVVSITTWRFYSSKFNPRSLRSQCDDHAC